MAKDGAASAQRLTTARLRLYRLAPLLVLALLAAAAYVLHNVTRKLSYHELVSHLRDIPAQSIAVAAALTLLSYVVLTGYDLLALAYIRRRLYYGRVALASFTGYVFSYNIGLSVLGGGAVRYRLYYGWGLSTPEIGRVIGFAAATFWLGVLSLGGVVFVAEPIALPSLLHLPFASSRLLGLILLACVGAYALWALIWRAPLRVRQLELAPPSPPLVAGQLVVSVLDNAIAAAVLYTLLPNTAPLSYPAFTGIYLLAVVAGLISHVPGGLGIFETVILVLATPRYLSAPQALSALVVYRVVYYFIPFFVGSVLLGSYELARHTTALPRVARALGRWIPEVTPRFLTLTTFAAGVILLTSSATPSLHPRLHWLHSFLPLPFIELSHIISSVVGVSLLILARSIQRRIDAAYVATFALLMVGVVVSLAKGVDYEEAAALAVMALALAPCRRYFYRHASILSQPFTLGWIAAVSVAIAGSLWLGFFSYRHIEYSNDLWWEFALRADAPRFLRASVAVIAVAVWFAVARLLAPGVRRPPPPRPQDLERAWAMARHSRDTMSQLVLCGDKQLLFADDGQGFLMYGVEGRSWVSLGDPVGQSEQQADLAWRLRELADQAGGWAVFYQVPPDHLPIYLDLGLLLFKLGEEARVEMPTFTLDGQKKRDLRQALRKLESEGCTFEVVEAGAVAPLLDTLEHISSAWLKEKNTREKGFSLGFFDRGYLSQLPLALVRRQGQIIAFANLWLGGEREELSIDLMRHTPEAPRGVMDFLFTRIILWGRDQGYRWFNLGMAPFSGLEARATAPFWNRLGAALFQFGEYFYNFQGLRHYKEKYEPVWRPRYLASPGRMVLPVVMANIAALVSRGLKGVVAK